MLYLVFASWKSVERELERIGDGVAKKIAKPRPFHEYLDQDDIDVMNEDSDFRGNDAFSV